MIKVADVQAANTKRNFNWKAAANDFTGLQPAERLLYLGYNPPSPQTLGSRENAGMIKTAALGSFTTAPADWPAAVDWRNRNGGNYVTDVKDQSRCGSCVAFAAVAAVESNVRIARNDPVLAVDLSEAQLFYCHARSENRRCAGPNGGWWPERAMEWFRTTGVADEACYPYTPGDQNCTSLCADWQRRVVRITAWQELLLNTDMRRWIANQGPLVAAFTVYDDFFAYSSGVYKHASGNVAGGHAVCVVGYDDNDDGGCWICKNSWRNNWGEAGFFRIGYGQCGIDATMWTVDGIA